MRITQFIASVVLTLPITAIADDHQHSLEAHVHGVAALNIALEEQQLELQLESPAMNIFGFEYQPATAADIQTVKAAQDNLNNAAALFSLSSAAQCTLTSVEIESDLLQKTDGHDSHSHPEPHDAEDQHSEINAHYHYHCAAPDALNSINLAGFFKTFPLTEKIQVQLITADQQQGVELSHKHTQLNW